MQQRLKNSPIPWNQAMTQAVKTIKEKVQQLPPLKLPINEGSYILETDASTFAWGGILLERLDGKEEIYDYT